MKVKVMKDTKGMFVLIKQVKLKSLIKMVTNVIEKMNAWTEKIR